MHLYISPFEISTVPFSVLNSTLVLLAKTPYSKVTSGFALKNSIRALGNINVDAIEEYKEVKGRYEFMSTQVEDMEKAKADLEKLIGETLKLMGRN